MIFCILQHQYRRQRIWCSAWSIKNQSMRYASCSANAMQQLNIWACRARGCTSAVPTAQLSSAACWWLWHSCAHLQHLCLQVQAAMNVLCILHCSRAIVPLSRLVAAAAREPQINMMMQCLWVMEKRRLLAAFRAIAMHHSTFSWLVCRPAAWGDACLLQCRVRCPSAACAEMGDTSGTASEEHINLEGAHVQIGF